MLVLQSNVQFRDGNAVPPYRTHKTVPMPVMQWSIPRWIFPRKTYANVPPKPGTNFLSNLYTIYYTLFLSQFYCAVFYHNLLDNHLLHVYEHSTNEFTNESLCIENFESQSTFDLCFHSTIMYDCVQQGYSWYFRTHPEEPARMRRKLMIMMLLSMATTHLRQVLRISVTQTTVATVHQTVLREMITTVTNTTSITTAAAIITTYLALITITITIQEAFVIFVKAGNSPPKLNWTHTGSWSIIWRHLRLLRYLNNSYGRRQFSDTYTCLIVERSALTIGYV